VKEENAFDKIYKKLGRDLSKANHKFPPVLGLEVTMKCPNYCDFCCNGCTEKGEEMELSNLDKFLENAVAVCLTGGESLTYSKLEKLIDKLGGKHITVATSGINPNASKELKDTYYNNLEMLAKRAFNEKEITLEIGFTYSDGIEPEKRLKNFLRRVKKLKKEYNFKIVSSYKSLNTLTLHYSIVSSRKTPEKLRKDLSKNCKKILKEKIKREINVTRPCGTGRKKMEQVDVPGKCHILNEESIHSKEILIKTDGDVELCSYVATCLKPLTPIANVNKHSTEEILDRIFVYKWYLNEFQKRKGSSCKVCVNKGGFNDFLEWLKSQQKIF